MQATAKNIVLTICTTIVLMTECIVSRADDAQGVRWSYKGSSDMPDGIAFDNYVYTVSHMLSQSRQEAVNYLIFTLELSDDASNRAAAEPLVDIFEQAQVQIQNDKLELNIANYCPGATETRTNEQIYAVMDQLDDEYLGIYEANYLSTLAQLDREMATKLRKAIDEQKSGITIASLDHRVAWEATEENPDMRAKVSAICERLIAARNGR